MFLLIFQEKLTENEGGFCRPNFIKFGRSKTSLEKVLFDFRYQDIFYWLYNTNVNFYIDYKTNFISYFKLKIFSQIWYYIYEPCSLHQLQFFPISKRCCFFSILFEFKEIFRILLTKL